LTKTGSLAAGATGATGDAVNYTFTVRNIGNVTLTGAAITDPLPGLSAITFGTWPSGTAGTLAPGDSVTATATGHLTQANVNAGSVTNTATVSGKPPTGANVAANSSATVPVTARPGLTVVKSATPSSVTTAGQTVTYTVTATNTGNVSLSGVAVTDPHPGLSAFTYTGLGTGASLDPGQTATATATYVVQQSDINAGSIVNSATATGTTPSGGTTSGSNSVTIPATQAPSLSLSKSGLLAVGATGVAGDVVNYSFSSTNTGNVTLTGVAIADPLPGLSSIVYSWPAAAGTLAPGQTVTATASHTLTQAEVDAGGVSNTATVSGNGPGGSTPSKTASATVPITAQPGLATSKTATPATVTAAGQVVTFSITLTNTGNVTLTAVAATDALPGLSAISYGPWPSGTAGTLAPGQQIVATATYSATQADINSGSIVNTARGTGSSTGGPASSAGTVTVPASATPAITLAKTGALAPGATGTAGDAVNYTFTVKNTGNVTLTGTAITDPLPGLSTISYGAWPSGTAGTLAPGDSVTATATGHLTQANVDAGSVTNTATASGSPPTGANVTSPSSATVPITPRPGLTVVKSATPSSVTTVGQTVTYTVTMTNTGNVSLSGVSVSDPHPGLSTFTYAGLGVGGSLSPGQVATATATYTVQQSDLDAGTIANSATVTGTTPTGGTTTGNNSVTIPMTQSPSLSLTKSGALAAGATGIAGDVVNYSFSSTNTGNVTLTGVAITDPLPGVSTLVYTWPGVAGTLAPGQTVTATASHTLTQAEVDAGGVSNTATVSGNGPGGSTPSKTASATVPITAQPGMTISKSSSPATATAAGQTLTYSITLTNTGNVTLTGVAATDPMPGLSALSYGTWASGTAGTLAPGQQVIATGTYTVLQSDINAGSLVNTASGTGTTPTGVAETPSTGLTVPVIQNAALTVVKSGTIDGDGTVSVGNTTTFTVVVTNSGNLTLTGVTLDDPLPGLSAPSYSWPGPVGTLTPGQQLTATATYAFTQADVDAGSLTNTATATGTPPIGGPISQSGSTTVPADQAPSIALSKTGGLAAGATGSAGDVISYAFRATNTGNVSLHSVAIADPLPGLSALTYAWPTTAGLLLPGQSVTATASYTLTQADVDAGSVTNNATATATPPSGVDVTGDGSATVAIPANPSLSVTKSGTPGIVDSAGQTVTYTITVANTGNVTIHGVAVTDALPGTSVPTYVWSGTPGQLVPGGTAIATVTYPVIQSDIDAGSIINTATAAGTTPGGDPTSGSGTTTTTAAQSSRLTVAKTSSPATAAAAGEVITYTVTATNAGNTTLTSVTVADPLPGLSAFTYTWPAAVGTLLPGQSVAATATYTVRQSDVDAGSIVNAATATGTTPGGPTTTGGGGTTVPIAPSPGLTVTKSAAPSTVAAAGDAVTYTITTTNTGNVTLTGVTVADPLPGLGPLANVWDGTAGTLSPGQSVVSTATYTVTQANVDAASLQNTATASGTDPSGTPISDDGESTITATANPGLTVTKSASPASITRAGQTVTFTITASNTGNVTLTGVTIADPLPGLGTPSVVWPTATPGTIAPGQHAVETVAYTVTQTDVNAGSILNAASATGITPGGPTTGGGGDVTVPVISTPGLSVVKFADVSSVTAAGDLITFTVQAVNTGNVTLTGVSIADPLLPGAALSLAWPATPGTLDPGQSVIGTGTHVVTQTDIDAGSIVNVATGSGTAPDGSTQTQDATATVSATQAPGLYVSKTAVPATAAAAGDVITYTVTVRDTGNTRVDGIDITDALPGISGFSTVWPASTGTLLPGEFATATATYTVTQADVDAGSVVNTAAASGTTPGGVPTDARGSTTVPIVPNPSLTVAKSASPTSVSAAGDAVTYTVTAQNTGNVTLTGVTVSDPLTGLGAFAYTWPGAVGTLAPGQVVTATATYTATQNDIDAGSIVNVASVTGSTPTGTTTTGDGGTTVPATQTPLITLDKTGVLAPGSTGRAGDTIDYSFTVTNAGNVTLTGVAVSDPMPGLSALVYVWPNGIPGQLLPGQVATATATYTITQDDVDAGSVVNAATVAGDTPAGPPTDGGGGTTVPLPPAPALTVSKTASPTTVAAAGIPITYTIVTTNTGNDTLTDVAVTDPLPGLSPLVYTWHGTPGSLAPGEFVTATATYTSTQADIDAESIANTATATGTDPKGTTTTASGGTSVAAPPAPGLIVTKTAAPTSAAAAGDLIAFSVIARNTGNVTLTGITETDVLPGLGSAVPTWPGTPGTLAPGEQVSWVSNYTATQADVNAGSIVNSASVDANTPGGPPIDGESTTTVPIEQDPGLTVSKTASPTSIASAGDVITYTITATNSGNVLLTGVRIDDPMPGLSGLTYAWPGTTGQLDPGQVLTATATYTATQTDIDHGTISNVATVSGTDPSGTVLDEPGEATVTAPPSANLTTVKSASPATVTAAGEVVTYTITSTNTGNVTLTGVAVSDPLPGASLPSYVWPTADVGVVPPGQAVIATVTYTATQADIDAGSIVNTAHTTGTTPGGPTTEGDGGTTVPATQAPGISITKTGSLAPGATGVAGDHINYTFTITNTGNVTLTGVAVDDPLPGLSSPVYSWPTATLGQLRPGEGATATATYAITQADLDAGSVVNAATVIGSPPGGPPAEGGDGTTVPLPQTPSLTVVKTAAPTSVSTTGDVVTFTVVTTNTGNLTESGVTVSDPMPGLSAPTVDWPGTPGILLPGQKVTNTWSYTMTQADIDAGGVTNTATATATDPKGGTQTGGDSSTVSATADPGMSVSKTATPATVHDAGDVLTYSITSTNTGNVTETGVIFTDPMAGLSTLTVAWPNPAFPGRLLPGETATATGTYTLTQADVDAGGVINTVTVTGTDPGGGTTTGNTQLTVPVTSSPALTVAKTASPDTVAAAGDVVTYTIVATNTGNITLTGVTLTDPLPGLSAIVPVWQGGIPGTLAPGQNVTGTATYTVTQADLDAGGVSNTATATAKDPNGTTTESSGSTTVTATQAPSLTVVKSASPASVNTVGQLVTYSVTVNNTGNVTLTGVVISDPMPGLSAFTYAWHGATGEVAPGDFVTATATHAVTQADLDAGAIVNSATATGTTRGGTSTDGNDSVTTPAAQNPALTFTKTGALAPGATGRVGDLIDYTFRVTNTGNVTVTDVDVVDTLPGVSAITYTWPGAVGTLAPGQVAIGTATYKLTVADVDAGSVANSASVTAVPPSSGGPGLPPLDATDTAIVPVPPNPQLEVVKSGSLAPGEVGNAGDTITYTFVITNTGNTTMTDVAVTDPLSGLSAITYGTWPEATDGLLLSGESVTATATWTVTQAAVTAGSVSNTAVVSGDPPVGVFAPRSSNTVVVRTNKPADPSGGDSSLVSTGGFGLAYTGSDPALPTALAILLLLFGATLYTISVRRRKSRG
jgi:uncharacterized repeat protein (TIGR01451 family)